MTEVQKENSSVVKQAGKPVDDRGAKRKFISCEIGRKAC